jgi:GNAT superfamily N-acetyltransferase
MLETYLIRFATPADVTAIFGLIYALAEYEKLTHLVTGDVQTLESHLFGEKPSAEVLVAEVEHQMVGFALFFPNYSTFLTKPGIYLEDIFVLPSHRRQGIGKALLVHLAKVAIERDAGRLEWTVLDWNQPAIDFYQQMGATVLDDWRVCRVTGEALQALGDRSSRL